MDYKIDQDINLDDQIFDVRFHPKGDVFAAATIAGDIHLIESGKVVRTIRRHHKGSSIRKVRFFQDGRMCTIAKTVKVHDLNTNQTTHTLKPAELKTQFYSMDILNNDMVCAGDDDGRFLVWDLRTPGEPVFTAKECDQYISDIDDRYEAKKLVACTSGEGTLTAWDLRQLKMIEPQSELFEAGFQCLRFTHNKKIVIGGEDGAIYVFNQGEWAHTSGKFAISDDTRNRGKCSIDALEILPTNDSMFLVACSDGKLRSLTLWPHTILSEKTLCNKSALESLHFNNNSQLVVCGDNHIQVVNCEESEEVEEDDSSEASKSSSDMSNEEDDTNETGQAKGDKVKMNKSSGETKHESKRPKLDTDDYLNVFK